MDSTRARGGRVRLRGRRRAAYSAVVPTPRDNAPSGSGLPSASSRGNEASQPAPGTPTFLRRLGAVLVDWLLGLLVVGLLGVDTTAGGAASLAPLGVFALLNIVLISVTGSTIGHRLFGMQVWQVRPGSFPLQVVGRTLLLCLFVPAVLTARDGRGYHDVWAGTRIVRV